MNRSLLSLLLAFSLTGPLAAQDAATPAQAPAEKPADKFGPGFARLQFVAGSWSSVTWKMDKSGQAKEGEHFTISLVPILGGKYLEGNSRGGGVDFRVVLSYDQQREAYAMAILDSGSGVLDVYRGSFNPAGELTLDNGHGFRVRLTPQGGGWQWTGEYTRDQGATWRIYSYYKMTPAT